MSTDEIEDVDGYGDDDHVFKRNVEIIDIPNRIYALGGGGMQMVLEMFEQNWFSIEAMRGRERNIDVYLLDTATEHNVADDVEQIEQKTSKLEQKLRDEIDDVVGAINFNFVNITRRYTVQDYSDLCGDYIVDDIFSNTDAENWWVSPEHLESPSGAGLYEVSKGVIKRRALGKAMHYKAQSQESNYNKIFQGQGNDEVAIFAGVGGGTGSGILLDVAKEIDSRSQAAQVTLFSTLPTTREHANAKANAYAALCELEHLQLSKEEHDPFDDIILFPLEPTQHSRGTTETEDLKEFDSALTYAVCGYYNHDDSDFALELGADYAPFTMAVPQVIHYSRDETANAKEQALKMLKTKRQLLNQEHRLFREFDNFVDNNFPSAEKNNRTGDDLKQTAVNHLHDRMRDFEMLINFDLFDLLNFEVITEEGDDLVSEIYKEYDRNSYDVNDVLQERDIKDIIHDLKLYATGVDEDRGLIDDRNELEEEFVKAILYTEIYHLEELYERLCTVEEIKHIEADDLAARLLEYLLLPNVSSAKGRNRLNPVADRIESLEEESQNLDDEIDEVENKIEQAKSDRERRINALTKDWYEDVREDIEEYKSLSELDLAPKVRSLKQELTKLAGTVESAEDTRTVNKSSVRSSLEEIQREINQEIAIDDIEFSEYEEIKNDLEDLIVVREDWDEIKDAAEDGGGLIFGGDPDIEDERGDYIGSRRQLSYFTVPSPPATPDDAKNSQFRVEADYNASEQGHIVYELENKKSAAKTKIVDRFREITDGVGDESGDEGISLALESENIGAGEVGSSSSTFDIEQKIEDTTNHNLKNELTRFVEEAVASKLDDRVPELEERTRELEEQKDRKESTIDHFDSLIELYTRKNPDVEEIEEKYNEFRPDLRRGVGKNSGAKGIELTSNFVQRVDPKNIEKAIQKPSLNDPDLLKAGGEKHRIKRYLTRLTDDRFMKQQYNGLSRNTLSDGNNFTDTAINFAVMSEAISNDTEYSFNENDFNFDDSVNSLSGFNQRFRLDSDDKYEEWLVSNSHPWEMGACMYIQGISFLDNLYGVNVSRESYAENYEDQVNEGTAKKMIARHTFGLNKGYYVRRLERESVTGDPSLYIDNTESEIRELLLNRHEKVSISDDSSEI